MSSSALPQHALITNAGYVRYIKKAGIKPAHIYFFKNIQKRGFEPLEPFAGSPDYQSGAFSHSATSPDANIRINLITTKHFIENNISKLHCRQHLVPAGYIALIIVVYFFTVINACPHHIRHIYDRHTLTYIMSYCGMSKRICM